jgi:hypothetical protein
VERRNRGGGEETKTDGAQGSDEDGGEKRGKRNGRTKEAVGKRKVKRRRAATVLPEGEREEKKTVSVLTRDEKCGIIQSNSVNVKF